MNPGHKRLACVLAVAGLMLFTAQAARTDVVLERNAIAMRTLTTQKPMANPLAQARVAAIIQLAVFEAVNAERDASLAALPKGAGKTNGISTSAATNNGDDWPNIHVKDAYTRDAAARALEGASRWLAGPKCQTLFREFKDKRNLPLTAKLRELDTDPEGYLQMVLFLDGAQSATCRRHGVLAFTTQGSRVVYLCGEDFERAWRRDVAEVKATVVHEVLHSLGLGENPPSPRAITHRIHQLCW